jgi:hypothetical protein
LEQILQSFTMDSDIEDHHSSSGSAFEDNVSSCSSDNEEEIHFPYDVTNDCHEDDIRNSLKLAKDAQDILRECKVMAQQIKTPLEEARDLSEAGVRLDDLVEKSTTLATAESLEAIKFALLGSSGEGKFFQRFG